MHAGSICRLLTIVYMVATIAVSVLKNYGDREMLRLLRLVDWHDGVEEGQKHHVI